MRDASSKVLFPGGTMHTEVEHRVFTEPHLYAPAGPKPRGRGRSKVTPEAEEKPRGRPQCAEGLQPWSDMSLSLDASFKILAISDRDITLKVLKAALKESSLTCVSTLSAAESWYDLILLETMSTGGTCVSSAEAIRAKCPQCPIVCLLTQPSPSDKQCIQSVGNAYILQKPFHSADLVRTVAEVVAAQGLGQGRFAAPQST